MFFSAIASAFSYISSNLKTVAIVVGSALVLYFVIGYFNVRSELKETQDALNLSQAQVSQLQADIKEQQEIRDAIAKADADARKKKEELNEKLNRPGKKSMTELAQKHPKLVEKAVNEGTKKVFECVEKLSAGKEC